MNEIFERLDNTDQFALLLMVLMILLCLCVILSIVSFSLAKENKQLYNFLNKKTDTESIG